LPPQDSQDDEKKQEDNEESREDEATVFNTPDGLKKLFVEANFKNIQIVYEESDIVYTNEEQWWAQQWSHGARGSLEKIDPHSLERLKADFFNGLQPYKQEDGIHLPMQVLFTFGTKLSR
jgi:hypothetical protein